MERNSLAVLVLLAVTGCPHAPRAEVDSGPEPDVRVGDMCGTLEGLDDPPEFVGSCVGPADSSGDRGCMEVTTKPNAVAIGTPCMRAGCEMEPGNTWSSERCGGDYVFCSELRDDDGVFYQFFATNPASCASM